MFNKFFKKSTARASRVNIIAPTPASKRAGLAICAIMRNEERHIGDWLRFHAAAGVQKFYLYDNLSTDGTVAAARKVPGIRVMILPWKLNATASNPEMVIPQQIMAYCHAICTFGCAHRWMAFIDIDECLVPRKNRDLLDALAPLEAFSNISLPWAMFGINNHKTPPKEAAPFAYTRRASVQDGALLNFKCIVDPCMVSQVSVHKFQTRDMGATSANDCGVATHNKRRRSGDFLSNVNIQLNHYYTRSREEMEEKITGSAVSGVMQMQRETAIRKKIALIEANPITDTAATDFLARKGISDSQDLRNFGQKS